MTEDVDVLEGTDHASRIERLLNPERSGFVDLPDHLAERFRSLVQDEWKESPSKITTYIECPLRWLLENYLLEGDESEVEEANFNRILGSIVHRIFENFYNERKEDRTRARLLEIADVVWQQIESGENLGAATDELVSDWQLLVSQQVHGEGMGKHFVTTPYKDLMKKARSETEANMRNLLAMERPTKLDVVSNERWARLRSNGIRINCKIDRIIRDPDEPELEIISDYKTGKTPWGIEPDDDIDLLNRYFVACGIYALARSTVSDKNESGVVGTVELMYTRWKSIYPVPVGPDELDLFEELLNVVTSEMREVASTGEIRVCPAENSDDGDPCRMCPVRGLCPAFADGDDLWAETMEQFPELEPNEDEDG